jgi:hypothetical protein
MTEPDVRQWFHYPIEMPLSADGQGPATIGADAASITYEVWDVLLNTHASFDNLHDAINEAMRLNAALDPTPNPKVQALVESGNAVKSASMFALGTIKENKNELHTMGT